MMYLAYQPPGDEEQALGCEALRDHMRCMMEREPGRFRMRGRRKARRLPAARKGSDDPLRLAKRQQAGKAPAAAKPGIAEQRQEAAALISGLRAEARKRGLTLEDLAERAGYSERTLRRRLKTPETLPLGEFCRIFRVDTEGGEHG